MFYTTNFRILPTENYYTYLFRQSRAKQIIMIFFFHRMILDPKISCINIPIYSARYISVWIHFDNSTFNSRSQKLFQITIWHETKNTTECLTTLTETWFGSRIHIPILSSKINRTKRESEIQLSASFTLNLFDVCSYQRMNMPRRG